MLRSILIAVASVTIAFTLTVLEIQAQSAPTISTEDRTAALSDAFDRLKTAPEAGAANTVEREIWRLWFAGPDADAAFRLQEASAALRAGAFDEAQRLLDALLVDRPEFAEAWNQRAFAKFLKGDLYGSLADIEATLAREPRHFGALAGRARIEARLGRMKAATRTMGEVAVIHPWMARASAIPADPPPPDLGEKL